MKRVLKMRFSGMRKRAMQMLMNRPPKIPGVSNIFACQARPVFVRNAVGGALLYSATAFGFGVGEAQATEVMTDRCSSHVAFPTTGYDEKPDAVGTVILSRPESGYTPWTSPFTVETGDSGRIRWWCNSTIGNWADFGTYRFDIDWGKALQCSVIVVGKAIGGADPDESDLKCVSESFDVDPGGSAYNGFTPERSRCDNRSNYIRARLGPERLLQIECLDPFGGTIAPRTTDMSPFGASGVPAELSYLNDLSCHEIRARDWSNEPVRPVVNWWSSDRTDNAAMVHPGWIGCSGDHRSPDYWFHRIDGFLFSPDYPQPAGTVPIYHYWNGKQGDNLLTGHPNFAVPGVTRVGDYTLVGLAGYAFAPETQDTKGLVELHSWFSRGRADAHTLTHPHWDPSVGHSSTNGYDHFLPEGYLIAADGAR